MTHGLVVDNFSGGGGASTGIEMALGRPVDIAINHSAEAIAMHEANHPHTLHLREDVWDVDPVAVCAGRPVDLVWLSPDCFPAGTMVLTRTGYRSIETIEVGDEVLTHESRWRAVTRTMRTHRPLLSLRGHGHPGLLVSSEHPFLARQRCDRWNNERRGYDRQLGPAAWVSASDLDAGSYWASPISFPASEPPPIPSHRGTTSIDARLMWLVGLYIADGWTRLTDTRAELVITCGRHEVDDLRARLSVWPRMGSRCGSDEMSWCERETYTAYQFTMNHRGLVEWLREHFGHGAAEKRIPGWALGMAEDLRSALVAGYLSGDGYRGEGDGRPLVMTHTVSKALAFGTKALAQSLGFSPTVYLNEKPSNVIQGREVNARPAWSVRWRDPIDDLHRQTERDEKHEWSPVRESTDPGLTADVFNLSVEEDESYIVDGIVVHNCTHFSRAKGATPLSNDRRGLAWVAIRWAETMRPAWIFLENVAEWLTWGPLLASGRPDASQSGVTFRAWLARLTELGYRVEWRTLAACDFGTPTTRKRLFLVAHRDDGGITWPTPTHGPGHADRWRTAGEIIDWTLPTPSIFGRSRSLAEATLARVARGIERFAGQPFVVRHGHYSTITGAGLREGCGAGTFRGQPLTTPLATVCGTNDKHVVRPIFSPVSGTRRGPVAAWLVKYYGTATGQSLAEPLHTVTAKARFGLVTIHGEDFEIVDIGMRMLEPHELFAAQGFPESYNIRPIFNGKPLTKTAQIKLAGNSVCPQVAEALVSANVLGRESRRAA